MAKLCNVRKFIYWVYNKELVAEMWKVISNWLLLADISNIEQRTGHLSVRTSAVKRSIVVQ